MRLLFKDGLFFVFTKFVRLLIKGGFYSRAASIQENTLCALQKTISSSDSMSLCLC